GQKSRARLGGHDLARLHRALHGGIAEVRDQESEAASAILHDAARQVEQLQCVSVRNGAADQHHVSTRDGGTQALVALAVWKCRDLDRAHIGAADSCDVVPEKGVALSREDERRSHIATLTGSRWRAFRTSAVFRPWSFRSNPTGYW